MDAAFVHTPRADEPQVPPGMLLELAAACHWAERARLPYRGWEGRATVRGVDPYRLVEITDPPDPTLLVSRSVATGPYPLRATVRLPMPLDQALRLAPSTIGTHQTEGPDATLVEVGGLTPEGLATYLLGLGTPLHVLTLDSVRKARAVCAGALPGEHREKVLRITQGGFVVTPWDCRDDCMCSAHDRRHWGKPQVGSVPGLDNDRFRGWRRGAGTALPTRRLRRDDPTARRAGDGFRAA
ncbi:hypothetical protein ABTX99_07460 [Streptomyces flaveolus]|uniref:hypothetical protein n=1 Tax=Streptomyces flaveolus TaxID=67297 RepID=UPI003323A33A